MRFLMASCLLVGGLANLTFGQQGDKGSDRLSDFMRAKLTYAQQALEGLALENFDQIAKSAQEISLLSNAAQWQVIQTPEYVRLSGEFRRSADDLRAAAKDKNLDGATLAYVRMTVRCVDCHKYIRSVRHAQWNQDSTKRYAAVLDQQQSLAWKRLAPH